MNVEGKGPNYRGLARVISLFDHGLIHPFLEGDFAPSTLTRTIMGAWERELQTGAMKQFANNAPPTDEAREILQEAVNWALGKYKRYGNIWRIL